MKDLKFTIKIISFKNLLISMNFFRKNNKNIYMNFLNEHIDEKIRKFTTKIKNDSF
jgi:hypothetical protein